MTGGKTVQYFIKLFRSYWIHCSLEFQHSIKYKININFYNNLKGIAHITHFNEDEKKISTEHKIHVRLYAYAVQKW
jgi:hypothetical protein